MDITMKPEYQLRLTKRELTLITKALAGKLSPRNINAKDTDLNEIEEAQALGLLMLDRAQLRVSQTADALGHAKDAAERPT